MGAGRSNDSRAVFRRAIDAGVNVIDTCDYYSAGVSEEIVGTLVAETGNRAELVIATKVGNPMGRDANARGYSRKHIIEAENARCAGCGRITSTSTRPTSGIPPPTLKR